MVGPNPVTLVQQRNVSGVCSQVCANWTNAQAGTNNVLLFGLYTLENAQAGTNSVRLFGLYTLENTQTGTTVCSYSVCSALQDAVIELTEHVRSQPAL